MKCYQSWQGNVGHFFAQGDVDFIITYDFASFIVSGSSLGILLMCISVQIKKQELRCGTYVSGHRCSEQFSVSS